MTPEPAFTMVEILGRSFALKTDLPKERLLRIATEVDEQLRQIQKASPATPLADVAITAALNLACELMEYKEDYQQLRREVENRSRQLLQKLEV